MNWIDKTLEGQTLLEEEIINTRKIETEYEGSYLKTVELLDKRGNKLVRITSNQYGGSLQLWIPKTGEEKKED